jgi:predicted dehydrogenase
MSATSPIRFGLIGAGRWGKVYLRTLNSLGERCRLTHLCTSDPRNQHFAAHPVTLVRDWRELVRSSCDAVIIATPPDTHAEILEACLDAGKPCIVEKPLCLDVASAERLHQRVQASGIPVLVDHTYLFHPAYLALKEAMEGAGEPVRIILSEGGGFGPFRTHTSALWDWCPHDFSLCLDLVGERPQQVSALAGPRGPDGAPESVSVRLDFFDGVCAWVHAGRLFPNTRRSFSVVTDAHLYRFDGGASPPLTVSPVRFSTRYAQGNGETLEGSPIEFVQGPLPMERVMRYFADGLSGGDRSRFGTALACDVVRLLAQCDAAMRGDTASHGSHAIS